MRAPVGDWSDDFDHYDAHWAQDPYPIWAALRSACPMARTTRYGGVHLPTRYEDVRAIAYDTDHFSSATMMILDKAFVELAPLPPLTSDPPHHLEARRISSSALRSEFIDAEEPEIVRLAEELADALASRDTCDAAVEYAHPLAMHAGLHVLGLPARDADRLRGWLDRIFGASLAGDEQVSCVLAELTAYIERQLARRRYAAGPGAIGRLVGHRIDGAQLPDAHVIGSVRALVLAAEDTTASALGAALWHLAANDADRSHLARDPSLIPAAVEELLRLYAPASAAREVVGAVDLGGARLAPGELVLLCYPAANRDPAVFPDPDRFLIGRESHRHMAFGAGIHRCIGAGLARAVLRIGLTQWLARFPDARLDPHTPVEWSRGSIRGPKVLRLRLR